MKKTIVFAAALFAGTALTSHPVFADKQAEGTQEIKGKLTGIDGQFYLIKDTKGAEHRVHFDNTTKVSGELTAGVDVEAYVKNDHVTEIKVEK